MIDFKLVLLCVGSMVPLLAAENIDVLQSKHAERDIGPDLDVNSGFWRDAPRVLFNHDSFGNAVPNHGTEVRSRWTSGNLYFLFICPFEELHLKPNPKRIEETNQLWNWDVAEAFIGSDFQNIRRYKEFEISPQSEWVDLDINLDSPHPQDGWLWNSGLSAEARIDPHAKIWYAFMRIPYSSVDTKPARAGSVLRLNLFRAQGSEPGRKQLSWQPTHKASFHVPEAFGSLKLVE